MLKNILTISVLGIVAVSGILVTGCASKSEKPYSLTGQIEPKSYSDQVENNWRHAKGLPSKDGSER